MNVSLRGHITDAVKHRYLTDLNVSSQNMSNKIIDAVTPTYVADHTPVNNYEALTISPMNASLIGASSIPFNNLIKLSGIDMKRFKKALRKVKERELTFVSVGYGGLSINVLHFLSMLAYRVDVNEVFKSLHIYENDNISYTNIMRVYKDLTHVKCNLGARLNKTELFDEDNLAEDVLLHQYYLTEESIGDVGDDVYFFGAPDFKTREMLEGYNFIFAGHNGDDIAFVYKPKVDTDLTVETYGTINLASFYLNMMKAAESLVYVLADEEEIPAADTVFFEHNAKKDIQERYEVSNEVFGKDIHSYAVSDDIMLII